MLIEVCDEDIDKYVIKSIKQSIKNHKKFEGNRKLLKAMHRVIAYYSVIGEYKGGRYDLF